LSIDIGPIVNPANGHTYYRLTTSKWTDAESEAVGLGGHLVTINDAAENNWVFDTFSQPNQYGLWIGLHASAGQFVWSSREPVTFTDWASDQPDNFGDQDFVEFMVREDGQITFRSHHWADIGGIDRAYEHDTYGGLLQGVVEVATPDLAATPPTWNTTDGGVDFGYTISGADAPQPPTIALYWASGTTSDTIIGSPIATPTATQTVQGASESFHVTPAQLGTPPQGAKYLLAVVNPPGNNHIPESDETNGNDSNDVASVAYDPVVTTTAKYDGNPDPAVIGRFFAVPGAMTDETFTVKLSDSLAALRPVVAVEIPGQTVLTAHPKAMSPWDGETYETDNFDPGVLSGDTPMVAEAVPSKGSRLAEQDVMINVVSLPDWILALTKLRPTFQPVGDGPDGTYSLQGFVYDLLPNAELKTPANMPLDGLSNKRFSLDFGFCVTVSAPLNLDHDAVAIPSLTAQVIILDQVVFSKSLSDILNSGTTQFNISLDTPLDRRTLEPTGGLGATFSYTDTANALDLPLFTKTGLGLLGDVPFVYSFTADLKLDLTVNASLRVVYQAGAGLQVVPEATYIDLTDKAIIEGKAEGGWFIPDRTGDSYLDRIIALIKKRSHLDPGASIYALLTGELDLDLRLGFKSGVNFGPEWVTAEISADAKLEGGIVIGLNRDSPIIKIAFDVLPIFYPTGWGLPFKKNLLE
jgi:hypothetical protein